MGSRQESRSQICVAVRIFGTDAQGRIFSENVTTVNVSRQGAEVRGIKSNLQLNDTVGVGYGSNKSNFRVRWLGQLGTAKAGHVGLVNLTSDQSLWDFPLPMSTRDGVEEKYNEERRRHRRVKITNSAQLFLEGGGSIWGTSTDLSLGGCYVEMQAPLPVNTRLKLKLWVQEQILNAEGRVAASTPGVGVGIQFTKMNERDVLFLNSLLGKVTSSPFGV